MPLQKQLLTVLLGGPMQQSVDARVLDRDSMVLSRNVLFDKLAGVVKAPGLARFTYDHLTAGTQTLRDAHLAAAHGRQMLVGANALDGNARPRFDGGRQLNALVDSDDTFNDAGIHVPVSQSQTRVYEGDATSSATDPDVALGGDFTFTVWIDSNDGLVLCVTETATDVVVLQVVLASGGGLTYSKPHVVLVDTNVIVTAAVSTNAIVAFRVPVATPASYAALGVLQNTSAVRLYDVCRVYDGTNYYLGMALCTAANTLLTAFYTDAGVLSASFATVVQPIHAITIAQVVTRDATPATSSIVVAFERPTFELVYYTYTLAPFAAALGPIVVADLGAVDQELERVTLSAEWLSETTTFGGAGFRLWAEVYNGDWPAAPGYDVRTWRCLVNAPGGVYQNEDLEYPGHHLHSKAFIQDHASHAWLKYYTNDGTQHSIMLARPGRLVGLSCRQHTVATYHHDKAASLDTEALGNVVQDLSGAPKWYYASGVFVYSNYRSVSVAAVDFSERGLHPATFDRSLLLPGGKVDCYDGLVNYNGFLHAPEVYDDTPDGAGGKLVNGADYLFVFTYEWTDANGLWHVSAPSIPHRVTIPAGGGATGLVDFVIRTHLCGHSPRDSTDVRVCMYRTLANGSEYHLETSVANVTAFAYVAMQSTMLDATLEPRALLYTAGGVLGNTMPPPAHVLVEHRDRIIALDDEDPRKIMFSKPKADGVAAEFTYLQYVLMPEPIYVLCSAGDAFFAFGKSCVYALPGDGPDALGNGAFYKPTRVVLEQGSTHPRSVLRSNVGVLAQTRRGILAVSPNGAALLSLPVRDLLENNDVLRAEADQDEQRVRFLLDNDTELVYDYEKNRWSQLVRLDGAGVVESVKDPSGVWWYFTSNGAMYYETPGSYLVTGVPTYPTISMRLETPWLKTAGISGFQRVWWVQVAGKYKSPHGLQIDVYMDYDDGTVVYSKMVTVTSSGPYLLRVKPAKQKCAAMKIVLTDTPAGGTYESCELSSVELVVGVKSPVSKASRR